MGRRRSSVSPSINYDAVLAGVPVIEGPAVLGEAILDALAGRYLEQHGDSNLLRFTQSGAVYLFDLASAAGVRRDDRTVAAYGRTPEHIGRRDSSYQRGFPMVSWESAPAADRGHLIPHLSGGEYGPNLFRQNRALNRGWSEQGKRYRALEREAAAAPGTLFVGHLLYTDETDYPREVEVGVRRGDRLHVERFDNRPSPE